MTHSELEKWRKYIPVAVFTFCMLPYVFMRSKSLAEAKLSIEIVVPACALVAAFFYVGLDLRTSRWKKEINKYVGNQIRAALLEMIPKDLKVTEDERQELAQREVFKDLTGVFWEAVDRNALLTSHKEHFYSNGIVYSTSIDVFLISSFAAFLYAVGYHVTSDVRLAYTSGGLIIIAVTTRLLITPRTRARHLQLSREQLDLLKRDEIEFVSRRYRDIICEWRRHVY